MSQPKLTPEQKRIKSLIDDITQTYSNQIQLGIQGGQEKEADYDMAKRYLLLETPENKKYFDEYYADQMASLTFPTPIKLEDKSYEQMTPLEQSAFQSTHLTPELVKEVDERLRFKPEEFEVAKDFMPGKTMEGLRADFDKKLKTQLEGVEDLAERERITQELYTNAFGGQFPVELAGTSAQELLGMPLQEKTEYGMSRLQSDPGFEGLTGYEKFKYALSQKTKDHSFHNMEEGEPYREQAQYRELAHTLDGKYTSFLGAFDTYMDVLTKEGAQQFYNMNKLAPEMFGPDDRSKVQRIQKGISEVLTEQKELLEDEENLLANTNKIVANQEVLYGLVDTINSLIPDEQGDLKISRDAVMPDLRIDVKEPDMKIARLVNELQLSERTDSVNERIRSYGGDSNLEYVPDQTNVLEKTFNTISDLLVTSYEEVMDPEKGARDLISAQIDADIEDLQESLKVEDSTYLTKLEINRLERLQEQMKEKEDEFRLPLYGDPKSPSLATLDQSEVVKLLDPLGYNVDEAMDIIRSINEFERDKEDDVRLNEAIKAMGTMEAIFHSSTNPIEASLDGDRIKLSKITAQQFLDDEQYKLMKLEAFPVLMQSILLQNIREFNDGTAVSYSALQDKTLRDLRLETDLWKNLTSSDLNRFVDYRNRVIKSSPSQAMQFFMDLGSTPTFDPSTETFSKSMNPMGKVLFQISPFPIRYVAENFVGAAESYLDDENPFAPISVATGAEGFLDLFDAGFSDLPSHSSRVAAKIAIGDPGLAGDLPYLAYRYGFDQDIQKAAELAGIAGDFIIQPEKFLFKSPLKRISKTVATSKYANPKVKIEGSYAGSMKDAQIFKDATIEAGRGTTPLTELVLPVTSLVDTAIFGSGMGYIADSVGGLAKGDVGLSNIGEKVTSYNKLDPNQQEYIDKMVQDRIDQGRVYTLDEITHLEGTYNLKALMRDGLDINDTATYAQKKFPNDQALQNQFVKNLDQDIGRMRLYALNFGNDLDTLVKHHQANEIANAPLVYAEAQSQYLENSTIPSSITRQDSYKKIKKFFDDNQNLTEEDKNIQMAVHYQYAKLYNPSNPIDYFNRVQFESNKFAKVDDSVMDNTGKFMENFNDDGKTVNDLFSVLENEPKSTRGLKGFKPSKEIDGIPVLFDESDPFAKPIGKKAVFDHYSRSLNRSVSKESAQTKGLITTANFLDSEFGKAEKLMTEARLRMSENNLVLDAKRQELENQKTLTQPNKKTINVLKREIFQLEKKIQKDTDIFSTNSSKALVISDLGTERYLIDERNKARLERIQADERFKPTAEELSEKQKRTELGADDRAFSDSDTMIKKRRLQKKLLKETGLVDQSSLQKLKEEKLQQKKTELESLPKDDFFQRQDFIEQIQNIENDLYRYFDKPRFDENLVDKFSLGNKEETARVRYVDEGDGVYRVETMRGVWAQKNILNLNKELYYRSELVKNILEAKSYDGTGTVVIPLGDLGIFHETMGKRVRTETYAPMSKIERDILPNLKRRRSETIKKAGDLRTLDDTTKATLIEDIKQFNQLIEQNIEAKKQFKYDTKDRLEPSHPRLEEMDEALVDIITKYVTDIDENMLVDVADDSLTIHLTDNFRNVLGRTIEEEPTTYYEKGMRFKPVEEELPSLPEVIIPEAEVKAIEEAQTRLKKKTRSLDEHIEKNRTASLVYKAENRNIKNEIGRLQEFLDTGSLNAETSDVVFYKRDDGRIVVSVGRHNIVGRNFEINGKKGFLFETIINKNTGKETQRLINPLIERAMQFEKYRDEYNNFVSDLTNFAPFLRPIDKYIRTGSVQGFNLTPEKYVELRKALGIESDIPKVRESYNLDHLMKGKPRRKGRKQLPPDETYIDKEFTAQFDAKMFALRQSANKFGIKISELIYSDAGFKNARNATTIKKEIKKFSKKLLVKFEEKYDKINTAQYRYVEGKPNSIYKQILTERQSLEMESLSVSQTTDLLGRLLNKDYEVFAFDTPSDHMLQNFSDILDQVGGRSSPDIIKGRKQIYPSLNLGITKDPTKTFFGQDIKKSLNTDVRVAIDYLSRKKLSGTEQKKLDTILKIFGIDKDLDVSEQKSRIKEGNDMYQTYQPKRTANTYFGLKRKSMQRLLDGIDEHIGISEKHKKKTDAEMLKIKRKEIQDQFKAYQQLEDDAVVFRFGDDSLHSDVMHFASDQTNGAGRLRAVMTDLQMMDEAFLNSIYGEYTRERLSPENITKSYVENMVLDSAQQGFDSFGFEKTLQNSISADALRGIAQRFGTELKEFQVVDRSGEIPTVMEFVTFVFPNDLKSNVSNVTGMRFVRSIETVDPVRVNGSVIMKVLNEGEATVRTPYGELKITRKEFKIKPDEDESVKASLEEAILNVSMATNRIDFTKYFDSNLFDEVDPNIRQDYQQSLFAKGAAYEYQKAIENYVDIEIQGLDQIEDISIEQIQRASKPNRGTVEVKAEDASSSFLLSEGQELSVVVEYRFGRPLTVYELIGLEQGIGLNDTLKLMEENVLDGKLSEYQNLGLALSPEEIKSIVVDKILPIGYVESTFAQHPKGAVTPLLPLLFEEWNQRETFFNENKIDLVNIPFQAEIFETPTLERPIFTEGEVVSQIEIDGDRLRVRVSEDMTLEDFLVTNVNILEMILPDYGQKHLSLKYDSVNDRLTSSGVKQFASDMMNYMELDEAPDLRTRSILDHTMGYLSGVWDLAHRQKVPETMAKQWNSIFDPVGKAGEQAKTSVKYADKKAYKSKIRSVQDVLSGMQAKGAKKKFGSAREMVSIPKHADLLNRLNMSPNVRKLQRFATDENGTPMYRYGNIKVGDEIDPGFLLGELFGMVQVDRLKKSPSFRQRLSALESKQMVKVTDKYLAPKEISDALNIKVRQQQDVIFGGELQIDAELGQISLEGVAKRNFIAVLNSLGDVRDTALGIPPSLVEFVNKPDSRSYITVEELNHFVDALKNREIGFGYTNRRERNNATKIINDLVYKIESVKNSADSFSENLRKINTIRKTLGFVGDDTIEQFPTSMQSDIQQYVGELRQVTSEINTFIRDMLQKGEEGLKVKQTLMSRGETEAVAQQKVTRLLQDDTMKRVESISRVISKNIKELEVVDRHKIGLFYRTYDKIIEKKNVTNMFELYTQDTLDNIFNILTESKKGKGITDADNFAINELRKFQDQYSEFKKENPNAQFILGREEGMHFAQMIYHIEQSFESKVKILEELSEKVFRRLTGYTKEDSGRIKHYRKIINRQMLTLLFEGRYIHTPSIKMVRRVLTSDDIFTVDKRGRTVFKVSREVLTKDSAKEFLYDNGFGFFNLDETTTLKDDIKLPRKVSMDELKEVVTQIVAQKEAHSIQTFLANQTDVFNNLLDFSPITGKQDALSVLSSLAVMSQELVATKALSERLTNNLFKDLNTRLEERKRKMGSFFIDDVEKFQEKVKTYVQNITSGTFHMNPTASFSELQKGMFIIDGEIPTLEASDLSELHAFETAKEIFQDLDIEISASRKDVAQYEILGKTYILTKDAIMGLENLREEIIGNVSLGKFGDSELADNLHLIEKERQTKTSILTHEQESVILKDRLESTNLWNRAKEEMKDKVFLSISRGVVLGMLGSLVGPVSAGVGTITGFLFSASLGEGITKHKDIRLKLNNYLREKGIDMKDYASQADILIYQLLLEINTFVTPETRSKLENIRSEYLGKVKPNDPSKSLYSGKSFTLGATATAAVSMGYLVNPYVGFIAGAASFLATPKGLELLQKYNLSKKEFHKQFVEDVQKVYADEIRKLNDKMDNVEYSEQDRRAIEQHCLEIRKTEQYLRNPERRSSEILKMVDNVILTAADAITVTKVAPKIKASVTAYSGPQYWSTSYFGLLNQNMLDLGFTRRFKSAIGGFGLSYALTGQIGLSVVASKVSVLLGDYLDNGKNRKTQRGATGFRRPSQVAMVMSDIQETSLPFRSGVEAGVYTTVAAASMGLGVFAPVAGVLVGTTFNVLLEKHLKSIEGQKGREKFSLMSRDGKVYKYQDVLKLMRTYNVLTTYIREETASVVSSEIRMSYPTLYEKYAVVKNKNLNRSLLEIAEGADLYFRIGEFMDLLEEGVAPKDAAEQIRSRYFDYSDLTKIEKNLFRNVFLFYSFQRKNAVFMFRKLIANPERFMSWARLTKDSQQYAFEDKDSEFFVGNFWAGRMFVPNWAGVFNNVDVTATKQGGESVTIAPMTNIYDFLLLASAIIDNPVTGTGREFNKYLATSASPTAQALLMSFTKEVPFTEMPLEYQNITPRTVQAFQKWFGHALYGPESSNALIKYKSITLAEDIEGRTQATAERREIKEPLAITEGRRYRPASDEDGFRHFVFTQIILPSTHSSVLGKVGFAVVPTGRPARLAESLDQADAIEQIVGASAIDLACRYAGFETKSDIYARAVERLAERGVNYENPDLIAKEVPILVREILNTTAKQKGVSESYLETQAIFAEEYIRNDATPLNGLYNKVLGTPLLPNLSNDAIKQQYINQFEKDSRGKK